MSTMLQEHNGPRVVTPSSPASPAPVPARAHPNAVLAVILVVAHGLLIIWGYAVTAHAAVTSETATLITRYPDVLMATVAGLLLVGVGISSARAARRRLRYETWYYLHFYTYVAVALAFS